MPPSGKGGGKWSKVPTSNDIRGLCKPATFEAGRKIYEAGNVAEVSIGRDTVSASVFDLDTDKEFDVEVSIEFGYRLYTDCQCEMSYVYGSICPHIVATMLHMAGDPVEIDLYGDVTEETISKLLERTSPEQALSFLTKMMTDNKRMLHRFITENELKSEYGISRYEGSLASLYANADKSGGKIMHGLDFVEQFNEARKTRMEMKHADSIVMYKAISETIEDKMDMVVDDSGYYADCFVEALEGMVECMLRERPEHDKKREYISYLFGRASAAKGAGFSKYYRGALETICSTDADLKFWQGMADDAASAAAAAAAAEGGEYGGDELAETLRMKSYIFDRQGRHSDTALLLGEHYTLSGDICTRYLRALQRAARENPDAQGDGDLAGHAARAMEAFSDDTGVLEAAYELAPEGDAVGARILERLYAMTGEWNHIMRLKHVLPNWSEARHGVITRAAEASPKHAVALCLKEDMPDKALDVLDASGDMDLLASYRAKIMRKRPREYMGCYVGMLLKFAGSKSSKDHYKRVLDYLTALKDTAGSDDYYKSALEQLKKTYSGRRSLMKDLSKI